MLISYIMGTRKGIIVVLSIYITTNVIIIRHMVPNSQNYRELRFNGGDSYYKKNTSESSIAQKGPIFMTMKRKIRTSTVSTTTMNGTDAGRKRPSIWFPDAKFEGQAVDEDNPMRYHYLRVFQRLGYRFVQGIDGDWDLLWATSFKIHKLPFHIRNKLKPHQKVHGIPGMQKVTNKNILVVMDRPYIPKSFSLPEDSDLFKRYTNTNEGKGKQWLVKGLQHNGQSVVHVTDNQKILNQFLTNVLGGYVIQEMIPHPFLVGGRKFDLAVYVTVTSIAPLRVYMDAGDWFVRYCPKSFHPYDPAIRDKYVIIRETFNATWEVPELRDAWVREGLNNKQALLWYIRNQGLDSSTIEEQIEFIIRDIFIKAEAEINYNYFQKYKKLASGGNFFEFYRLDFLLDDKLKVHLIELNDGPGMGSRRHKERWRQNERTIFSMLHLMGMAPSTGQYLLKGSTEEREMQVSPHELVTFNKFCLDRNCSAKECKLNEACRLCMGCWNKEILDILTLAAHEHYNRNDWTRVMPKRFSSQESALGWAQENDSEFLALSPSSQLMFHWFRGKCFQDKSWC